ncbi:hypothetical protein BKA56DRAFT_565792 [Ilyonectria sp. MPI-CAGE-AT-0026]|nr:hypothetical protein BKA56DRAFT_565792 [Ilyonectria sp. MPI-CAGE-AT-0026]
MRIGHLAASSLFAHVPMSPKPSAFPSRSISPGLWDARGDPIVQGKLHQRPLTTATWQDPLVNSGSATSLVSPGATTPPRPSQGLAPAARWQAKPLDATCPRPRGILVDRANQASICGGPNLANGRNNISRRHPESPGRAIPPITWTLRKSRRPDLSRPATMGRATLEHCPLARVRTIANKGSGVVAP